MVSTGSESVFCLSPCRPQTSSPTMTEMLAGCVKRRLQTGLLRNSWTFVLDRRWARLSCLIECGDRFSQLWCRTRVSEVEPRNSWRMHEQELGPAWRLWILKSLREMPLTCTVPCMSLWNDHTKLSNIDGQLMFGRILKSKLETPLRGTAAFVLLRISLEDDERRSCQQWNCQLYSNTMILDRQGVPVFVSGSGGSEQRICQRCWGEKCPCNCYNHFSSPCSYCG